MRSGFRNQSGFTLIELLVVIVIIGILAAIALPNFIKARNKAREAEVKANVHSIQLALERYAVDNNGVYPTFLCGGERDSNILWCSKDATDNGTFQTAQFPYLSLGGFPKGVTPYAIVAVKDVDGSLIGPYNGYDILDADPILSYGYLAQYPKNPFARRDAGMWNADEIGGTTMHGFFPFGGHHGDIMFDLGFGWGDAPQTDFVLYMTERLEENDPDSVPDPDLDSPGNFYYHPTFGDTIPVYFHTMQIFNSMTSSNPQLTNYGIYSEDVLGFFLYGYGAAGDRDSLVESGQDLFNRMPRGFTEEGGTPQPPFPGYPEFWQQSAKFAHHVGAANQIRAQTTGYNSTEFDPFTGAYPDGINPRDPDEMTVKSGSDGILDWVIVCVAAGSDNAPDIVRDTLRYGEEQ